MQTLAIQTSSKSQHGFTLVELTVSLLILVLLAGMTLPFFSTMSDNSKYQITQDRVTQIKQAIVNVTSVNGVPVVSGFVADVHRLPGCIQELIDGTCQGSTTTPPSGWQGPYLQTTDGSTFYDGWGNGNLNDPNFGWNFQLSSPTLRLQSYGADGASGGTHYDTDYPINPVLIAADDWLVDLSSVGIKIQLSYLGAYSLPTLAITCGTGSSPGSSITLGTSSPSLSTSCSSGATASSVVTTTCLSGTPAVTGNGTSTTTTRCPTPTPSTTQTTCSSGNASAPQPTSGSTATTTCSSDSTTHATCPVGGFAIVDPNDTTYSTPANDLFNLPISQKSPTVASCGTTYQATFTDGTNPNTPLPVGQWWICAGATGITNCSGSTVPTYGSPLTMTLLPRVHPAVAW